MRHPTKALGLALTLLMLPSLTAAQTTRDVTLWLWHGEHDLRGLTSAQGEHVSVAYLSRTLVVEREGVRVTPRRDAIHLDPDMVRTAVVHMEIGRDVDARMLEQRRAEILQAIAPVFEEEAHGIQFDFDAPRSMHQEYAALLREIGQAKPRRWTFSMTALGSWCTHDRWLDAARVDFVVPMLFGPGHDRHETLQALADGPLPEPLCREALGLRENQDSPNSHAGVFFIFGQGSWTVARARSSLRRFRE